MSIAILFWPIGPISAPRARADDLKPAVTNAYEMVTGDDSEDNRRHWDQLYSTGGYVFGKEPARFVKDNLHFLPRGRALDIAMGEGRNAVFLARQGYQVDGVDYSDVALRKARRLARENHVNVNTINADLERYVIKPETYDVIMEIDYLQRNLVPQIKRGLKKGGVVIFENYTVDQLKNTHDSALGKGMVLERGELKELFKDFEILLYRETNNGKEARASLVARKR